MSKIESNFNLTANKKYVKNLKDIFSLSAEGFLSKGFDGEFFPFNQENFLSAKQNALEFKLPLRFRAAEENQLDQAFAFASKDNIIYLVTFFGSFAICKTNISLEEFLEIVKGKLSSDFTKFENYSYSTLSLDKKPVDFTLDSIKLFQLDDNDSAKFFEQVNNSLHGIKIKNVSISLYEEYKETSSPVDESDVLIESGDISNSIVSLIESENTKVEKESIFTVIDEQASSTTKGSELTIEELLQQLDSDFNEPTVQSSDEYESRDNFDIFFQQYLQHIIIFGEENSLQNSSTSFFSNLHQKYNQKSGLTEVEENVIKSIKDVENFAQAKKIFDDFVTSHFNLSPNKPVKEETAEPGQDNPDQSPTVSPSTSDETLPIINEKPSQNTSTTNTPFIGSLSSYLPSINDLKDYLPSASNFYPSTKTLLYTSGAATAGYCLLTQSGRNKCYNYGVKMPINAINNLWRAAPEEAPTILQNFPETIQQPVAAAILQNQPAAVLKAAAPAAQLNFDLQLFTQALQEAQGDILSIEDNPLSNLSPEELTILFKKITVIGGTCYNNLNHDINSYKNAIIGTFQVIIEDFNFHYVDFDTIDALRSHILENNHLEEFLPAQDIITPFHFEGRRNIVKYKSALIMAMFYEAVRALNSEEQIDDMSAAQNNENSVYIVTDADLAALKNKEKEKADTETENESFFELNISFFRTLDPQKKTINTNETGQFFSTFQEDSIVENTASNSEETSFGDPINQTEALGNVNPNLEYFGS